LKKAHSNHLKIDVREEITIKTNSFVGFIQCPSGQIIRINPKIPIKNMLYMLAYTYDLKSLSLDYIQKKRTSKNTSPIELYLTILIKWTEDILKKGIYKSYNLKREFTSNPKGQILGYESMLQFGKLCCQYEDITYKNLENSLIKSTLLYVVTNFIIKDKKIKLKIRKLLEKLGDIPAVTLNTKLFESVHYNGLNKNYKNVLELCKVLYLGLRLEDTSGNNSFSGYMVNMNVLFEKFLLKILQKHIQDISIKPSVSDDWFIPIIKSKDQKRHIPDLKMDILIKNKLIIEAKYYREPLNKYGKLNPSHLNQLQAYMTSQNLNGLLVYAGISDIGTLADGRNRNGLKASAITFPLDLELMEFEKVINRFIKKVKSMYSN
jgi:5-methylcytosine-specific restriction enzyme subunit McrC